MEEEKRIYIVDGHSLIYRAYYAFIRRPLLNSKGFNTSAIFGFLRMILRIIKVLSPKYMVVSFDTGKPNFRHKIYTEYKETRKKMPDDLKAQVPILKNLTKLFGIPQIEVDGYESDDVIGKLALDYSKNGFKVFIITKDKDLFQLVDKNIFILQPETVKSNEEFIEFNSEKVIEKFGVSANSILDFLALTGDTSDNIPGVQGVGPVAAKKLINMYKSIENIYDNIDKIEPEGLREKLIKDKENAFLSKKLIRLALDLDLKYDVEDFKISEPDKDEIVKILNELDIKSLLKELGWDSHISDESKKIKYMVIDTEEKFEKLLNDMEKRKLFALDTETDSIDPISANLVGISISMEKGVAYYIPVGHSQFISPKQLSLKMVVEKLKKILNSKDYKVIGQNIKYDYLVLRRYGIDIANIYFDTMVASYLINPTMNRHNLDELSMKYLSHKMITYKELLGKEYKKKSFTEVPIDKAAEYSGEDADITFQIYEILSKEIEKLHLSQLYSKLDIPLIKVLADMELNGVKIDTTQLLKLSQIVSEQLDKLTKDIYKEAGEVFNINSPKQLSSVLFEKLNLPSFRKGKTGKSTDVQVLEKLKNHHPIAEKLLNYRSLNKLLSTYIEVLPKMINSETGRIHTSFSQTTTATGRLSSSNPNLQNIPIRDEMGRKIREAFVAEKDNLILSADYSQIELRILAHIAGDEVLVDAFRNGEDIHNRTVMEIYQVDKNNITPELRRMAKVINYGVSYGMGPHNLSQQLNITHKEAEEFIEKYFNRYKGIKKYMDDTKKRVEENGYVENIFGRRRYLPDMSKMSNHKNLL